MNIVTKSLVLGLSMISLQADGCWSSIELSEYAQDSLEDIAVFSFKDAVDCTPLSGVSVNFLGKEFTSDEKGSVSLPLPPDDIDAEIPISMTKDTYIPVQKKMPVSIGNYWETLFLMTKEIPLESARFILSWGKEPADLDLHLTSDDFHISYRKTRSIPDRVNLDRDAREGYGPETITLDKLRSDKTYKLLIHRYSQQGAINQNTKLSTYLNNSFNKTVFMEETDARCLQVAVIKDKKIVYETQAVNDSECQ